MKKLLFLLIFLCLSALAYAMPPAIVGTGGEKPAAGGESWEISETFDDLDDWTEQVGDWTIVSGTVDPPAVGPNAMYHNTALANAYRQYLKVEISTATCYENRFVFRLDTAGAVGYCINHDCGNNTVQWKDFSSWDVGSAISATASMTFSSGEWIGVEVEGTGTDTVVRVWEFASDPGHRSTWGAADVTWTDNPGTARDTAKTVGLGVYYSDDLRLDNFYAASSASGP